MRQFNKLVIEKVDRRVARKTERNDFLKFIMEHEGTSKGMTENERYSNAALLVTAGTETSATALAGTIYHLTRNPHVLIPLQKEIRDMFASEEDITFKSVVAISNLLAVLHENMRMYPSVAVTNPRRVPPGGAFVAETWLPENVSHHIFRSHMPFFRTDISRQLSVSFNGLYTILLRISTTQGSLTRRAGREILYIKMIAEKSSSRFQLGLRIA